MHRRDALKALGVALIPAPAFAAAPSVTTVIGTGVPGYSDQQVNNPYGLAIGPDGALYFCDLDNQRIRRLDLTTRRTSTIAGNGQRGYAGDGAATRSAALNMPHEIQFDTEGHLYIAERDNHVVRKVDAEDRGDLHVCGNRQRRILRRRRARRRAQLRQPHSIAVDRPPAAAADLRHRESSDSPGRPRHRRDRHVRGNRAIGNRSRRRAAARNAAERSADDRVRFAPATSISRCGKATPSTAWMPTITPCIRWLAPASRDTRVTEVRPEWQSSPGRKAWRGRADPSTWRTPRTTSFARST